MQGVKEYCYKFENLNNAKICLGIVTYRNAIGIHMNLTIETRFVIAFVVWNLFRVYQNLL